MRGSRLTGLILQSPAGSRLGGSPTGRPYVSAWACMRDGRVFEAWSLFDSLGLVQQLGLVSAPKVTSTRERELVDAREVTRDHAIDLRRS